MQSDSKQDRRSSANPHIDHMLAERKELLSLYLELSKLNPDNIDTLDEELLGEFCQVLVDYIAAGHFSLYDRIASGKERRQVVSELADKIYPMIEESTRIALHFSELYNSENKSKELSHITLHLSKLGEHLTSRIEHEDRLISCIMSTVRKEAIP